MQDIHGEEAELGNGTVEGAVGKAAGFLEPADVGAQFAPGNIFGGLMEEGIQVSEIRADVGAVTRKGMAGKATEGDHLPIRS